MNFSSNSPFLAWAKRQYLGLFFAVVGVFFLSPSLYAQIKNQTNFAQKYPDVWKQAVQWPNDTLNDVQFIDENHGWIVGNKGTVARTTDGGITWETIQAKTTGDFFSVNFINKSVGWAGGTNGALQRTRDGGVSWESLQQPPLMYGVRKLQFVNEKDGLLTGDTLLYKTNDGGISWVKVRAWQSEFPIVFDMIDSNTWWAGAARGVSLTRDAGKTWELKYVIPPNYPSHVRSIEAIDDSNCLIFYAQIPYVGFYLARTSDAGDTWTADPILVPSFQSKSSQYSITDITVYDVDFLSPIIGFVVGTAYVSHLSPPFEKFYEGVVLKTLDGGKSWNTVHEDAKMYFNPAAIAMKKTDEALVAVPKGGVVAIDGERKFQYRPLARTNQNLNTIGGTDSLIIVLGGYNNHTSDESTSLFRSVSIVSTSKGKSWTVGESFMQYPNNQIRFKSRKFGWKAGYMTLSRTNDGGKTWKNFYDSTSYYVGRENVLKAYFQGDSTGWLLTGGFTQLFSFSGSKATHIDIHKFERNKKDTTLTLFPYPTDFSAPNDSTLFVTTAVAYVLRIEKTNGQIIGKVLPILPSPQFGQFVKPLRCFFVTSQTGWVICSNGEIFKTADGGESWLNQTPVEPIYCRGGHFISEQVGYLVGEAGTLLKTTNGGTTWTKIETHTYNNLNDINFIDGVGYIVGDYGTILRLDPNAAQECQLVSPATVPFRITKF